jgi:hypothetical protein
MVFVELAVGPTNDNRSQSAVMCEAAIGVTWPFLADHLHLLGFGLKVQCLIRPCVEVSHITVSEKAHLEQNTKSLQFRFICLPPSWCVRLVIDEDGHTISAQFMQAMKVVCRQVAEIAKSLFQFTCRGHESQDG